MLLKNCFSSQNFDYSIKSKRLIKDEGAENQESHENQPPTSQKTENSSEKKEIIPPPPPNEIALDQIPGANNGAEKPSAETETESQNSGTESKEPAKSDSEGQLNDEEKAKNQEENTDNEASKGNSKNQHESSGVASTAETQEENTDLEPHIPASQEEAPDLDKIMEEVKKLPPQEQIGKLAEISEKEIAKGHMEKIEWKDVPVGPITTSDGRKVMAIVKVASHGLTFKDKNGHRLFVPGNGNTAGKLANILNVGLPTATLVNAMEAEAKKNNAIVPFTAIPKLATTANPKTGQRLEVVDPKTGLPIKPDWRKKYGTPHAKIMQSAAALKASTDASFAEIDEKTGKIVAGDGKNIILDADQKPDLEVIYGGINEFGARVQNKNGTSDDRAKNQHELSYADYSHRITPVHREVKLFEINDKGEAKFIKTMDYYAVLQDKEYCKLLSHKAFNADGKYGIKVNTVKTFSSSNNYEINSASNQKNILVEPTIPTPSIDAIEPTVETNQEDRSKQPTVGTTTDQTDQKPYSEESIDVNHEDEKIPHAFGYDTTSTNQNDLPGNENPSINNLLSNTNNNTNIVDSSKFTPEKKDKYLTEAPTLLLGDSCTENVYGQFENKDKITSIAKQNQGSDWLLKEVKAFAASPEGQEKLRESIKNIFILIGVNDIAGSAEHIFNNIKEICRILKEINPALKIMIATIPPFKKWQYFGSNYSKYEEHRQALNKMIIDPDQWLDSNRPTKIIDFATLMADPNDPESLNPEYNQDQKDGLHPDKNIMAKFISEGFKEINEEVKDLTTQKQNAKEKNKQQDNKNEENFINSMHSINKISENGILQNFKEHPEFDNEQYLHYQYGPEKDPLSISINAPNPLDSGKPVKIVFYANPNGSSNAIAEGYEASGKPGGQHFLAQIRALRDKRPDEQIIAVTMTTKDLSFPAWRKRHPNHSDIFNNLLNDVKEKTAAPQAHLSLLSHSGGGGVSLSLIKDRPEILQQVDEIAWLDAHYGYKVGTSESPTPQLIEWLKNNPKARLVISAYDDRKILGRKIATKGKNGQIVMAEVKDYNYDRTLAIIKEFENQGMHLEKIDQGGYLEWTNGQVSIKILKNPSGAILHTEIPRRNGIIDAIEPGNYNKAVIYQKYIQQNPLL